MLGKLRKRGVWSAVIVLALGFGHLAHAQISPTQPLITQPINESVLTVLAGNVRPEVRNPANDLGAVPETLPLEHLLLQLRRPATHEQSLQQLLGQLHDPDSPYHHQWLSATEFGAQFGPAASDIQQISNWLQSHGFRVNVTYPSGMAIDFSGTAGQVAAAFHTQIHYIQASGERHFANVTDPQIPSALAPAVVGIVSLNDFRARKYVQPKPNFTFGCGGGTCFYLVPADLATIYNFNPLFSGGNTGAGQSIYIIEDTDLYSTADWTTFRTTFGLTAYSATLNTIHPAPPSGTNNCTDPGVNSDDDEAILDAEWATAAAPSAAIIMATCANTTTFGGLIAIQNLVNSSNPPAIISLSYGECEANLGSAGNAAYNSIYQQGVAEGVSIYVSSGDNDAAICDNRTSPAQDGIAVSGFASTPYNVAVGGTDFSDTFSWTNSTYWNSSNGATFGSAKSYVPEIPWNETCGSQVIATFLSFATTYGSNGLCNSTTAVNDGLLTVVGGSGGPSTIYSKPPWQTSLLGVPSNNVRNLPDVSLFSSSGIWGHGYIFCFSDPGNGGNGCSGSPSTWNSAGGTSFAAPIWAGIQALINNHAAGARQGLPNFRLYALAAIAYGTNGSSTCNSSSGNSVGASCIFYDVTLGDNDAPCLSGSPNCFDPSGTYGVLSTSTTAYQPAFPTQTGWDFATGIGTVNVANLVTHWDIRTNSHDFNGDGKSDIVWRDNVGDVSIWLMNGAAVSSAAGLGNVPIATWSIVSQRDFNGDGKSDLLWRDTSGDTAIWFMNGTAVASSASLGNIPSNWTVLATGNLTGEGTSAIFWRDTSGDVAVWLVSGASVVASAGLGNVPVATWSVAGVGDFNGDGISDLLWRDTSGNTAIWFMNGTQVASSAGIGNIPTNWSVVGTGDFNGDGKSDIVWRDTAGDTSIWLMNGAAVLSAGSLGNVSTTYSIVLVGDFNGDSMSDLLWRDTSGNTSIWFMNGTTVSSTGGLGNIPTSWTVQSTNAD
jgi:hypothetical protein